MSHRTRACAAPGPLSSARRGRLPDRAFGLPAQRKYPLYTMAAGRLVPNPSHASNAKGRAMQELHKGRITVAQYARIVTKANKVLAACEKGTTMPKKKRAKKKSTKRRAKKTTRRKKKATKRKAKKKATRRKKKATKRKAKKKTTRRKKATKRRKKSTKRTGVSMREQQKRIRAALAG